MTTPINAQYVINFCTNTITATSLNLTENDENTQEVKAQQSYCKVRLLSMLGFLSGVDMDESNYKELPSITFGSELYMRNFYLNWGQQANIDKLSEFCSTTIQKVFLDDTVRSNYLSKYYEIGSAMLSAYFTYPNPTTNELPSLAYSVSQPPLLVNLYNFAIREDYDGLFGEYQKTLCSGIDVTQLYGNDNYKKWCGCYLDYNKNKLLDELNQNRTNYFKSLGIIPALDSYEYTFGNNCMPYCTSSLAIKLYYTGDNVSLFKYSNGPSNARGTLFEPVVCVSTLCLINEQSVESKSSAGPPSINQLCDCSYDQVCLCAISDSINNNRTGLQGISPGLDNPANLNQACGNGALCYQEDENGNISNLKPCPKNADGQPQGDFNPNHVQAGAGKFNPIDVDSIKYVDFSIFLYLIIIFGLFILFFLAVRYSMQHASVTFN